MTNKIIKIINKYTNDLDFEKESIRGENKVRRRRMLFISLVFIVLMTVFISIGISQGQDNKALQEQIKETEVVLEETNEKHAALKQEITQLNDDNYIRRIARGDFFMSSDSSELIFSLPESNKENNDPDVKKKEEK